MNVLAAENDEDENRLYLVVIESRGHTFTYTRDGKACLDVYKKALAKTGPLQDPFDFVILDHRLPGMEGVSVAREIVSLKSDQKLILTTTDVRETLKSSIRELRVIVPIMVKPFDPRKLVDIIEDSSIPKQIAEINKLLAEPVGGGQLAEGTISDVLSILKTILKVDTLE
jgi:CheY-like chemotaxis protein